MVAREPAARRHLAARLRGHLRRRASSSAALFPTREVARLHLRLPVSPSWSRASCSSRSARSALPGARRLRPTGRRAVPRLPARHRPLPRPRGAGGALPRRSTPSSSSAILGGARYLEAVPLLRAARLRAAGRPARPLRRRAPGRPPRSTARASPRSLLQSRRALVGGGWLLARALGPIGMAAGELPAARHARRSSSGAASERGGAPRSAVWAASWPRSTSCR